MTETTNNKDITQLLQSVAAIKSKYDEINRLTGADYNIFNVLKLQRDEVRLHSRFIGDLLNPKGKHGRGDVFLKLFLEQLQPNIEDNIANSFIVKNAKVYIEKSIGSISNDNTEGGQIDLIIEDIQHNRIIIENKIYAPDQLNQMLRYHNYDKNALLLYLTLYDKEASNESVTREDNSKLEIGKEYFNITYKTDIVIWLNACIKSYTENKKYSYFFRGAIEQYLNIVKQLTGQAMNDKMKDEIVKLLESQYHINGDNIKKDNDNILNYLSDIERLKEAFSFKLNEITNNLRTRFLNELFDKKLKGRWIPVTNVFNPADISKDANKDSIGFKYDICKNSDNFNLDLSIEIRKSSNYRNFICGIFINNNSKLKNEVEALFKSNKIQYQSDNYWVYLDLNQYTFNDSKIAWNIYDNQWNHMFINNMDEVLDMFFTEIELMERFWNSIC